MEQTALMLRLAKIQRQQKIGSRDWKALQIAMDTVNANWMAEQLMVGMEEYHQEVVKPLRFDDEQEED